MPFGIFPQNFAVCVGQDATAMTDFLHSIFCFVFKFNGYCYYCLLLLLIL